MPSIFIWKSSNSNTSNKLIKYYTGSNWFLEDNEYSSKSYMYLEQMVITGFDNSVITFNVKQMPQDWVGSELLEVTNIPYQFIKSDNYGTLEMVGDWMRFTTKENIQFNEISLINEVSKIKTWMNTSKNQEKSKKSEKYHNDNNKKQYEKYSYTNHNSKHFNNIDSTNYSSLTTDKIKTDFQEFLGKYNMNYVYSNTQNNYIKS